MEKVWEIGIIGLGKFGLQMARTLEQLGHNVIGVDECEHRVDAAQDVLQTVYRADATQISALKSLHFEELDCVMVSVGSAVEKSLSIVLNLQELDVQRIWAKANTVEHRKILHRLGVHNAILPEHDVASLAAHQLCNPGMLDLIPRYGGILVQELTVDKWTGKNLMELDLINKYEVLVIGVKAGSSDQYIFVPPAQTVLNRGDVLIVIGRQDKVQALIS